MKYLIIIPFIFGSQLCNAQNNTFQVEVGESQIAYRNIENAIIINTNLSFEDYKVVLKNCDSIIETLQKREYTIVPGKGRVCTIDIIDPKDSSIVHYSKMLKVEYLPNPELFYGASMNGTKIDASAGVLFAKYPPSYNLLSLNHSFEIISWKIIIGNIIFEGESRVISQQVKDELAKNKVIEYLSVVTIVKGPDGIARKIGGAFSIN